MSGVPSIASFLSFAKEIPYFFIRLKSLSREPIVNDDYYHLEYFEKDELKNQYFQNFS